MNDGKRDVRAVVRTYIKDGETKNVYQTIGTAWVSPHESTISIQLDCLPINKDWNGKLFINKPYEKSDDKTLMPQSTVTDAVYKNTSDVILEDIDDKPISLDSIPF